MAAEEVLKKKVLIDLQNPKHVPSNAALHQKSRSIILAALTVLITPIIKQGSSERLLQTDYPKEIVEIMLSALTFLCEPGIFFWTEKDMNPKLRALADMVKYSLRVVPGSFQPVNRRKQVVALL